MSIAQPIDGLATDPRGGGSIQNTGSGDSTYKLGFATFGTVANLNTLRSGNIDIHAVTQITLAVTFVIGSLTNARLIPEFSDKNGVVWYPFSVITSVAAATLVVSGSFQWTSSFTSYITIPNPGFYLMRLKTESTGTVTSSSMAVNITRGWANQQMLS